MQAAAVSNYLKCLEHDIVIVDQEDDLGLGINNFALDLREHVLNSLAHPPQIVHKNLFVVPCQYER